MNIQNIRVRTWDKSCVQHAHHPGRWPSRGLCSTRCDPTRLVPTHSLGSLVSHRFLVSRTAGEKDTHQTNSNQTKQLAVPKIGYSEEPPALLALRTRRLSRSTGIPDVHRGAMATHAAIELRLLRVVGAGGAQHLKWAVNI